MWNVELLVVTNDVIPNTHHFIEYVFFFTIYEKQEWPFIYRDKI